MAKQKANEIDICIGRNLKAARISNGLSRAALGSVMKTPISSQAIIGYEDGTTRIPAASLVELAWVLGCPLQYLFEGVQEMLPKGIPPEGEQLVAVGNLTRALAIDFAERHKV